MSCLESSLSYQPNELKFGTSGRRGLIADLTPLEIYINATAELEYLLALPPNQGGITSGDRFYFALDLRPSSQSIAATVESAILDAGLQPVNLGRIPTPALMHFALSQKCASIMITGSHIPFDRNGYKLNTSRGELLKHHETPIGARVAAVRRRLYSQPAAESLFDPHGEFRTPRAALRTEIPDGREAWLQRYQTFFSGRSLEGRRILVYQHSAVGRDILVDILQSLGAEVVPAGRSDEFIPIDTENIEDSQLRAIQQLADDNLPLWAVVSIDGDSDRPLVLGVDSGKVKFYGGDLVGMIVARYLNADAVVVPISCNDAIDRGTLAPVLEPKTRIGSPWVIQGMDAASRKGRRRVCGWEANGGFLLGSDLPGLHALATRDAFLPILSVLFAARDANCAISSLFDALPRRFSRAGLLRNFPRVTSQKIIDKLSTPGGPLGIASVFMDFAPVGRIDYTDGVRIYFDNGDVAHLRPSGNADEFRIYAVADTQARADEIVAQGIAEPNGILRTLERLNA